MWWSIKKCQILKNQHNEQPEKMTQTEQKGVIVGKREEEREETEQERDKRDGSSVYIFLKLNQCVLFWNLYQCQFTEDSPIKSSQPVLTLSIWSHNIVAP